MGSYQSIMDKHVSPQMKGKTKIGQQDLKKIVIDIGSKTSLSDGLAIAKGLIENYFLNDNCSKPILDKIDEMVFIQETAQRLKK